MKENLSLNANMNYDYILTGKAIYTLDEDHPAADWVAVKDKKIAKVGDGPIPEGCERKDFGDNIIIPGLIDSHVHAGQTAIMMGGVNLINAVTIEEVLNLIDERCKTTEDDLVFAPFFIVAQIEENRFPTRKELDAVSHGKKVMVISITLHTSAINTAAYEAVDYHGSTYGLTMDESGEFNGYLAEDEVNFYTLGELIAGISEEKYDSYITQFAQMCVENGITTAHCLEGQFVTGDIDLDLWLKRLDKGDLPLHCVLYPQMWDYEKSKKYNLPRHGGCLTLDGADLDYTMALDEPYTCRPEVRGDLYRKDSEVYELTAKAYADNKQIAFHAMGERAIDQVMDAYRRVIAEQGQKNLRLRVEHFTLPREAHIKMAAELGIVVSQQPEYTYLYGSPGGPIEQWFGEERSRRMEPYKYISDQGIIVAGGSDSPVNSLNPLTGIQGLVNARFDTRRMSVTEALKAYTYNAAYAAFEEDERGTIKEGYYADFTVLSEDPYEVSDRIDEIQVKGTISEGRVVFEK